MPLPRIKHPLFTFTIPSTKKKVQFRPFTVREEKILLMGKGQTVEEIFDVVVQVLGNCSVTKGIDFRSLPFFDIEYLFIKLRSKSVNEVIELTYTPPKGKKIDFEVNLEEVEVKWPESSTTVDIGNGFILIMKYPTFLQSLKIADFIGKKSISDEVFKEYISCISTIYEGDEEYSDFTSEELEEFVLDLSPEGLDKIYQFFNNLPSVEFSTVLRSGDGEKYDITLRGLSGFFQ